MESEQEPAAPPETAAPPEEERRREYRLNKMLSAEIDDEDLSMKARLFVINISRSGFRATNAFALPQEHPLRIHLTLVPKEPPLDVTVKVAWVKELPASGTFDMGFQFEDLSEEHWNRLTDFIQAEVKKVEPTKTLDLSSPWTFGKAN
jgi:hypothetical protein